jgi:hypothetical protein
MDEFKVQLIASCLNAMQGTGTDIYFVGGGYTVCVQILDKGINLPFKGCARENFEHWMMMNNTRRHPPRFEVLSWINDGWNKITVSCIKNTWRSVGNFFPGEFGDPTATQSDEVSSTPMFFGVSHDDNGEEKSGDKDEGVEYQEEVRYNEALFHCGRRLRSNLLDMEDEESLFVMEIMREDKARAK